MSDSKRIVASRVDESCAGQRLDLWLSRRFTYHSRRHWQEIVRNGGILVNNAQARCSRALRAGDSVAFIADREEPAVDMDYRIVYEDEFLLAIDKGGNLPCHPAGPFFQHTLWYDLSRQYGKVYIANRLDRETSGLLLVGKSPESAAGLSKLFADKMLTKKYHALVFGKFDREIHADGVLVPDPDSEVRKKRRFIPDGGGEAGDSGEKATTVLRPVKPGERWSLVEAEPATGRLHQIRATLCSLGYPLLGDKLYGPDDTIYLRFIDGKMTDRDRESLILPRQALHSRTLEFVHPFTGEPLCFLSEADFFKAVVAINPNPT